jgi:hypothetical protein
MSGLQGKASVVTTVSKRIGAVIDKALSVAGSAEDREPLAGLVWPPSTAE